MCQLAASRDTHACVQVEGGRSDDPIVLGSFVNEVSGVAWHTDDVTNLATCCDDSRLHIWRPMSRPCTQPQA